MTRWNRLRRKLARWIWTEPAPRGPFLTRDGQEQRAGGAHWVHLVVFDPVRVRSDQGREWYLYPGDTGQLLIEVGERWTFDAPPQVIGVVESSTSPK